MMAHAPLLISSITNALRCNQRRSTRITVIDNMKISITCHTNYCILLALLRLPVSADCCGVKYTFSYAAQNAVLLFKIDFAIKLLVVQERGWCILKSSHLIRSIRNGSCCVERLKPTETIINCDSEAPEWRNVAVQACALCCSLLFIMYRVGSIEAVQRAPTWRAVLCSKYRLQVVVTASKNIHSIL